MSQSVVRIAVARYLDVTASLATIAVIALVGWVAWIDYQEGSSVPPGPASSAEESARRLTGRVVDIGERVHEQPSAKAVILEFSDFQCQYCRNYSRSLYPTVIRELVESGKAEYAYRHFPIESLHNKALLAGQAAECAGEQGRFWQMHDALFTEPVSDEQIARHAATLRLNHEAFDACLRQGDAGIRVKEDLADARRLGIMGTPSFLIGTKMPEGKMRVVKIIEGAPAMRSLSEAVDEAIKATGA